MNEENYDNSDGGYLIVIIVVFLVWAIIFEFSSCNSDPQKKQDQAYYQYLESKLENEARPR